MSQEPAIQIDPSGLNSFSCQVGEMHCPSCELLMEKQLKKLPGVEKVEADANSRTVKLSYKGAAPSLSEINALINKYDYHALEKVTVGRTGIRELALPAVLAIAFMLVFLTIERFSANLPGATAGLGGLVPYLFLGVTASLSSCAALVGGLILSLSQKWNTPEMIARRTFPLLQFNLGRFLAFVVLGGLLGLAGSAFQLSIEVYTALVVSVALVMIVLGLQMLEIVPALNHFQIRLPKRFSSRAVSGVDSNYKFAPAIVGMGTFFLPCGFTINAQAQALTSASFTSGAAIMGAFALGTLPVLIGIGLTSRHFSLNKSRSNLFLRTAGIVVILFALYTINGQLNVLGLPSFTDLLSGV